MPVRDNFYDFAVDLDKFAERVGLSAEQVRKKVAFDLFDKVIDRTPVDTGRLRASWAMADGVVPDGAAATGTGGDAESAAAAARSKITATFADPFEVTWIANNLPYAERIEFGYSSQKAPAGMVRVSLAEIAVELETISGAI